MTRKEFLDKLKEFERGWPTDREQDEASWWLRLEDFAKRGYVKAYLARKAYEEGEDQ